MSTDVKQLVEAAAEAAKHAPKHLQEAAFNKAFEALMAGLPTSKGTATSATPASGPIHKPKRGDAVQQKAELDQLDRTAHPDIGHNDSALNNSLRLLRAAKDDLSIDGLTATQVAKVLVDKFRCQLTTRAVAIALNNAGRLVNRHKEGNLVVFRIMGPGEEYLSGLTSKRA